MLNVAPSATAIGRLLNTTGGLFMGTMLTETVATLLSLASVVSSSFTPQVKLSEVTGSPLCI